MLLSQSCMYSSAERKRFYEEVTVHETEGERGTFPLGSFALVLFCMRVRLCEISIAWGKMYLCGT